MACSKRMCTIPWIMVSGLKWADIVAEYALFVMMNYLTDTWGLGFAHAAGIINTFFGISRILHISLAFTMDTRLGIFKMLLLSSVAYTTGLAFLSMSTPPVLSHLAGNCNGYKAECVGTTQKAFFFTSLVLIVVGMAGHSVSLDAFLHRQTRDDSNNVNPEDDEEIKPPGFWSVDNFLVIGISGIAALGLSYIKPWDIKFGVSAIFSLTATLVFFAGNAFRFFRIFDDEPKGSGLTIILRVFVAAMYKCCHTLPEDNKELHETNHDHPLQPTNRCRCLNKAAIELPGEVESRWKLCSVTEVEETKLALRTAIVWVSFIICGLVSSIGNTFFIAQAAKMNHGIGKWHVNSTILLFLSQAAKYTLTGYFKLGLIFQEKLISCFLGKKMVPLAKTATAVVSSLLCCLIAALVETRRRNHQTKISIFWLIPQFYFLVAVDYFFEQVVKDFFKENVPPSMKKYALYLTHFVWGLGQVFSFVSIFACKKWFNNDVDQSRLDRYYWTLTALSAVNYIWYYGVLVVSLIRALINAKIFKSTNPAITP